MDNAKAKGKKIGRLHTTKEDIPAVFYRHYPAFMADRINLTELARLCRLSRPTVYKYLKLLKQKGEYENDDCVGQDHPGKGNREEGSIQNRPRELCS